MCIIINYLVATNGLCSVAYLGGGGIRPCPPLGITENISETRGVGMPPDRLELCRHYGLPLTKILAMPLAMLRLESLYCTTDISVAQFHLAIHGCFDILW